MADPRVKGGAFHEPQGDLEVHDTYPEDGGDPRPEGGYPRRPGTDHTPAPITRAADDGSAAQLRAERKARHGESGGYDDPRYGKVRDFPSQS